MREAVVLVTDHSLTYLEMNQSSSLRGATGQPNSSGILCIKNQLHKNLHADQSKGCQSYWERGCTSPDMNSGSFLLCWAILFPSPFPGLSVLMLMHLPLPPLKCILQYINQWCVCVFKKNFLVMYSCETVNEKLNFLYFFFVGGLRSPLNTVVCIVTL